MTGIPEYRGLANQDVRPLKAVPSASSRGGGDGGFVVSVEEFRQGINLGAGSSQDGGVPSGIPRGAPAGTAADSPLRGEPYVPKSWLRAQNGNGLSEDEKVAKLRKIRESAQEYEGLLMAEMIKQMRQKPMAKTPGSDTLSEIAEKPFTAALTAAGGLGLADKIVEDVASQEGLAGTLADHPEIMGPNWRQRIAPSRLYKPVNLGGAPGSTGAPGSPGGLRRAPDLPGGGQGLSATPRPASAPVSATASVPPEASPPMMPADPTTPVASTTATADIGDYAPASSAASGASGASRAASDIPIPAGATALKPGRNGFGNFRRGPGSPRRASGDNADADRTPSGARTPQPTHPVRTDQATRLVPEPGGSDAVSSETEIGAATGSISVEDLPPAGNGRGTRAGTGKAAADAWARRAFRPEKPAWSATGSLTPPGSTAARSPEDQPGELAARAPQSLGIALASDVAQASSDASKTASLYNGPF